MGSRSATPGPAAIEQAQGLLTRLIASGTVVALNLLGAVGEQPDFLAHSDALPYVLSLRGDKDWKHAPQKSSGHKVSPLVLELWKVLESSGVLTAVAARETLGRELTEAAVLRALCELWQSLRISPLYAEEGQATSWEMLRVRHREALATGGATSQVTAISLLVSMYLQSVYAATSEEIEIFLSPVASRSRVREAVRGLSATRQIHSLSMDAQTYHFLEGGLPEFAEPALPAAATEPSRTAPRAAVPPPGVGQGAPSLPRQPSRPSPAAAPPSAKGGWKSPGRAFAGGKVRPAPGARPSIRGEARPGTRGEARPNNSPAPWSRPKPVPGSAPRPVSAGGRGDAPFRPPQKTRDRFSPNLGPNPRPNPRPANPRPANPRPANPRPAGGPRTSPGGAAPAGFRPRPPRGEGRPAEAGRTGSYRAPGRPPGRASRPPVRPSAPSNRPGFPAAGRPATSFKPRENRPTRPGGARGFSAPQRSGAPSATGGANRGANYNRPRPGGYAGPGAKSASGSGEKAGRPPFSRSSGSAKPPGKPPARPWAKAGRTPGKPGKPSFRGGKPARKKPGA
jgi:23S rRNA pseudouridine2605 synthase